MTTGDVPRAKTAEEVRGEFLEACRQAADFWSGPGAGDRDCAGRIQGALHSWLVIIDGMGSMPSFDLVASPHPDDKEFQRGEGENWTEPGTVINDCMLHDLLYQDSWAHLNMRQHDRS